MREKRVSIYQEKRRDSDTSPRRGVVIGRVSVQAETRSCGLGKCPEYLLSGPSYAHYVYGMPSGNMRLEIRSGGRIYTLKKKRSLYGYTL